MMKIYHAFWDRDFSQLDIDETSLPTVGQVREVYIDTVSLDGALFENPSGKLILNILWYPSYSQINGWNLDRKEILGTHVIQCELDITKALPLNDERSTWLRKKYCISKRDLKYSITVLATVPFLNFCKNQILYSEKNLFYYCFNEATKTSYMIWTACDSYQKLQLEDNIYYIEGSGVQETHLGLIIEKTNTYLAVKYQEHIDPSGNYITAAHYPLQGEELTIFKNILEKAKEC